MINITFPERIIVTFQNPPTPAMLQKLDEILTLLKAAKAEGIVMAATLQQIMDDVKEETTSVDSLSTLIQGLKDQIAAANGDQAKIDEIFAQLEANKAKLVSVLAANTPAAAVTPAP